jgi:hypothetical protein
MSPAGDHCKQFREKDLSNDPRALKSNVKCSTGTAIAIRSGNLDYETPFFPWQKKSRFPQGTGSGAQPAAYVDVV